MENSESGDDLSHGYLVEQYAVNADDVLDQEENTDDSNGVSYKNAPLREQDRFLPIANVAKIMKRAIPENGKIAKDARECVQECISEFISFITSEASDRCHLEKRKTINGEDILFAMNTLGFDNYIEPLKCYLQKYREMAMQHMGKIEQKPIGYGESDHSTGVQMDSDEQGTTETIIYTYPTPISDFIG